MCYINKNPTDRFYAIMNLFRQAQVWLRKNTTGENRIMVSPPPNKLCFYLIWKLQMIVSLEAWRTNAYTRYASRTHCVTVIGVGSLSFYGDNHLEGAGSILTAGE